MEVAVKEVDDGLVRLPTAEPREEVVSNVNCYLI